MGTYFVEYCSPRGFYMLDYAHHVWDWIDAGLLSGSASFHLYGSTNKELKFDNITVLGWVCQVDTLFDQKLCRESNWSEDKYEKLIFGLEKLMIRLFKRISWQQGSNVAIWKKWMRKGWKSLPPGFYLKLTLMGISVLFNQQSPANFVLYFWIWDGNSNTSLVLNTKQTW
jgi:hypothetical protein